MKTNACANNKNIVVDAHGQLWHREPTPTAWRDETVEFFPCKTISPVKRNIQLKNIILKTFCIWIDFLQKMVILTFTVESTSSNQLTYLIPTKSPKSFGRKCHIGWHLLLKRKFTKNLDFVTARWNDLLVKLPCKIEEVWRLAIFINHNELDVWHTSYGRITVSLGLPRDISYVIPM